MQEAIYVSFDSHYKGRYLDSLSERINAFFISIVASFILFFISADMISNGFNFVLAIIFLIISLFGIVSSFFVPFFAGKNRGFSGEVDVALFLKDARYRLQTIKKGKPFYDEGRLLYVEIKKRTILFGKDSEHCFRLPKFCLKEEELDSIKKYIFALARAKQEAQMEKVNKVKEDRKKLKEEKKRLKEQKKIEKAKKI